MMTKNLTILGSTGSIGRQTLEVVEQLPVRVAALTAGQNVERMAEQCRRFRPQLAVMGTEEAAQRLREALAGEKIEIRSGMDGLIAAAEHPLADTVVTAVVGMLGLRPTLAAIRAKKRIALANKETLVCAGELVMREAAAAGAEAFLTGEVKHHEWLMAAGQGLCLMAAGHHATEHIAMPQLAEQLQAALPGLTVALYNSDPTRWDGD